MEKTRFVMCRKTSVLTALLLLCACAADDDTAASDDSTNGVDGTMPGTGGIGTTGSGGTVAMTGSGGRTTVGSNTGSGGTSSSTGTGGHMPVSGSGGAMGGGSGGMAAMMGTGGMAAMTGTGGSGSTSGGTPMKSAGCGMAPPASDTSIMVGSSTGNFILDLPTDYDNTKAYPLILVWHGAGVQNTDFHGYLDMHTTVGNDAIVVTPECLDNSGMWGSDMAYPDALLEHFKSSYCIDTSRLFTTGHSMGGMFTAEIGCQRGDVFRGDAVLAAPHSAGNCVKGEMGVMMSVGMSDFVANYMSEFSYWATTYGGCDMSMSMPVDPMTFSSGTPEESGHCDEYAGCAAGTPIRTCTFDGGHEIPPWVAGAVWSFFKKL